MDKFDTMTDKHIDILRNARDNHSNGTYQKALDAAIEAMEEVERIRGERNGPKPLTNAQHIRAMGSKEIAKLFVDASADGCPPKMDWDCCKDEYGWDGCEGCWENWLRQSAEGGGADG